jgi:hypothetical protein
LTPNLLTPCDFCPVSEKEIEVQVTTFLEHWSCWLNHRAF